MPPLIAFLIKHYTNGFLLGAAAALAAIALQPASTAARLVAESPVGLLLIMYGLGSSLAMGSLATALWFATDD